MQYMAGTWKAHSIKVYGEVKPKTKEREWYVAVTVIEQYLNQGYSESDIARIWNQGNAGPCVRGVNKWGVPYDSCQYEKDVMKNLRNGHLAIL